MELLSKRVYFIEDDYSWVYQIESVENINGKVRFEGWAFALNQDAEDKQFEIILKNIETEERIYAAMEYKSREDVNEYFLCEYDYTKSGFVANISNEKLSDGVYEIIIKNRKGRKAILTKMYYADDLMHYTNPEEFEPPYVENTEIKEIIDGGVLRVYRPDCGVYVYQYKGALYWIAETNYKGIDEDFIVQFQLNTTQIERLPEERLAHGWKWSNESFAFSKYELKEWGIEGYRIAKCELPKEYSVTQIWTGEYINDWVWKQDFRPWYEFE